VNRFSLLLLAGLIGSALLLVRSSYESRRLFVEIERAHAEEQQLAADTRRLEAERRSEGTHLRVERDARQKLSMRLASPEVTMYVTDGRAASAATVAAPAEVLR
jgi:cell division protein FtsL